MARREQSVVVGAGPVGLFAAHCLARQGVSVRVLDSRAHPVSHGYACGLHPSALACFERAGLLSILQDVAHRVEHSTLRQDGGAPVRFDLLRTAPHSPWLMLKQSALEALLCEVLRSDGIELERETEVLKLSARDGFVRVDARVSTPKAGAAADLPEHQQYGAKYVVGADGHFSVCRQALGVELVQQSAPKIFAMYDFQADLRDWQREACITRSAGLVSAFWPLGPELGRWTFQLWSGFDQAPSLDTLRALIDERAPWFRARPEQLCWAELAQFEQRVARRTGNGRIWLAGDAAHSAWPIGFRSMNQGFAEVEQLAQGIARELRRTGPAQRASQQSRQRLMPAAQ